MKGMREGGVDLYFHLIIICMLVVGALAVLSLKDTGTHSTRSWMGPDLDAIVNVPWLVGFEICASYFEDN
jgi:hypothetical protein